MVEPMQDKDRILYRDIYACGGGLGSACYRYDVDNDRWHMLEKRLQTDKLMLNAFMAAESRAKRLYLIGGSTSAGKLKTSCIDVTLFLQDLKCLTTRNGTR